METVLRVENIEKHYQQGNRTIEVLRDVSLKVGAGEIVSVTGKSGSGKTTLLDVVGGIQRPDAGRVWIGETEVTELKEGERTRIRRRRMGMVFQFFNLVPSLTAYENVCFPLQLNDLPIDDRPRRLMERLGIESLRDQYPSTLSGGEQQRVAIARALVHQPGLVLADEPTGNLDYDHARDVLDSFEELVRDEDVALLIGTHSDECARFSDRVLDLRDGLVRESS